MAATNTLSTEAVALIAVLPALTAAVVTTLGGYLSERRQERRAHAAWLREKRFEVYQEFITAMWQTMASHSADKTREDHVTATLKLDHARTSVALITDKRSLRDIEQAMDEFVGVMPQLGEAFKAGETPKVQEQIRQMNRVLSGLLT